MKQNAPLCVTIIFALAAPNAFAAEEVEANTGETPTVYTADSFSQFAPRTALEMVERIPGFSIADDDDGSRGFGQATGNVLINGQRVSGKSNGAESVLGRIAIANVARIELLDGTALGIPGLSGQVVTVITRDTGGFRAHGTGKAGYGKTCRPPIMTWRSACQAERARSAGQWKRKAPLSAVRTPGPNA